MRRLLVLCLALFLLAPTALAEDAYFPYQTSDWAREEVRRAEDLHILYDTPTLLLNTQDPISRGDFAAQAASLTALEFGSNLKSYLLIQLYLDQAEGGKNTAYIGSVETAKRLGILQGRGDGEDDVYTGITRQEAAVMLARTYRAYRDTEPETLEPLTYSDSDLIADWALDDVALMSQLGILNGVDDGTFDPLGPYTEEQCLVSMVRLHDKVPYDGSKTENPFALPARDVGFQGSWNHSALRYAAVTEDYYIFVWLHGVHGAYYDIVIVNQDLSLRSYLTVIIESSNSFYGESYALPENLALSEDGTQLSYTSTLEEDAYHIEGVFELIEKRLLFEKGVYTITMDLATGEQTWTRADLT